MPDSAGLSVQFVKGVGPHKARLLAGLGINTITDAFHYLPFRYEDRSTFRPITNLQPGSRETVSGTIVSLKAKGHRLSILEVVIFDKAGYLKITWFNQPYLKRTFKMGQSLVVSGMVKQNTRDMPPLMMESPEYETLPDDADALIHSGRVVPFYGLTEGISQKQLRKIMFSIIAEYTADLRDPLPPDLLARNDLPALQESIRELHFPGNADHLADLNTGMSRYHRRIIFEEFFLFGLGLAVLRETARQEKGISFRPKGNLGRALLEQLPFELTSAQKRVIGEIRKDMQESCPMNRLIQGDVGCGKTIVALSAMLDAVESGCQAVLMAPTEILAEQHFINIRSMIGQLGLNVHLVTGGTKKNSAPSADVFSSDIIIGTHALIQEKVKFRKLGLAVIDEQHKFGVMQRAVLRKKGVNPDVLVMTATPIPRSLALTVYGDLDCSVIDELPPNRKPVLTTWIESTKKDDIYAVLRRELGMGRQAYVVYPAIEESERLKLKTAVQGKEAFAQKFPEFRVGLMHGRMHAEERAKVMSLFKKKEIDILVSTTVIEVGVDVANASVMLIVHAERFGLSQLHQLRGRVGRGVDRSYCILIAYHPVGEDARRRLDIMVRTNDGFRIAEEDLAIRGPGEFLGTRQAGLSGLRNADIVRHAAILEAAKNEAFSLVEKDAELKELPFLKEHLDVFWKGRVDLFKTG
ncbi:MAG: ATP-dependent DNA helicase RecG [Nitrospirae bacterium]|nr:ATP-dependent DNA helicase RecG [Nitrospirota bacterium]